MYPKSYTNFQNWVVRALVLFSHKMKLGLFRFIHFVRLILSNRSEVNNTSHVETPGIREDFETRALAIDIEHSEQDMRMDWIVIIISHLFIHQRRVRKDTSLFRHVPDRLDSGSHGKVHYNDRW